MFWLIASTVAAAGMAVAMIFVRLRASKQPASIKKIILPPFFMSTGALMFVFPVFRVEWAQVAEALLIGMLFSVLLIRSSKFEIRGDQIFLVPSKAFAFILFGLLIVRIIFKLVVGQHIPLGETSGMFFLLAFGMIFTWRLAMLRQYLQLEKKLDRGKDLA
ncbi:cytochrome c biogenesis protein CcdC [Bacillus sp. SB49]|uniref:CcdC family protein n=1 Tax=Bacillus sp. SB49 TaxID=1071080 RepID=UPI0004217029|nr:cytochrome c biogenesis protein CcdC [Bacillus sp. SB49]QHT46754.1 cytochrome c biogenesis protein CcdC [Bacillus sp. SB49]